MSFTLLTDTNGGTLGGDRPETPQVQPGGPQPGPNSEQDALRALQFLNPSREHGVVARGAAGLGIGVLEDPIMRAIFEYAFGDEADDQVLQQLKNVAGDTTAGAAGRMVGMAASLLAPGIGAFGLGGKAALKVAGVAGASGRLGTSAARIAPRYARNATKAIMDNPELMGAGLAEKAAQSFGGSVGIGGFEATRAIAEDKPLDEVAKAFAVGFVLTAGFEAAFVGAGAALGAAKGRIKDVRVEKTIRPLLDDPETGVQSVLRKQISATEELLETKTQHMALTTQKFEGVREKLAGVRGKIAKNPRLPGFVPEDHQMGKEVMASAQRAAKAETAFLDFVEKKLPELRQETKNLQGQARALQKIVDYPGQYLSTRQAVFNPKGLRLAMSQTALKLATTPEGLAGKLGGTAARAVFKPIAEADQGIVTRHAFHDGQVKTLVARSQENMGFSNRQIRKDRKIWLDLEHAWEIEGDDGIRAYMRSKGRSASQIDDQIKVYHERRTTMEEYAIGLEELGAQPLMSRAQRSELGIVEYGHHQMLDGGSKQQIRDAMVAIHGEAKGSRLFLEIDKPGLASYGAFDKNRALKGSLRDKINDPKIGTFYESNPWLATREYLNRGAHRLEYGQRFGLNGELTEGIVGAVKLEAGEGAGTLVANVFDQVFNRQYVEQHARKLLQTATSYQIATKLGMGVIANMSQTANSIVFAGFRRTARAMLANLRAGSKKHEIEAGVGILTGSQVALGAVGGRISVGAGAETAKGIGRVADKMETFADFTLRATGFSLVEANNRVIAGFTGRYIFMDNIKKFAAGKLRGRNYDAGIRQMNSMGISPSETKTLVQRFQTEGMAFVEAKGGLFEELETRAIYRAAQLTQFTPGALRRPALWTHPVGRVMVQFKSFALNQGRFLKDQVFAEAAAGNLKPLAYVLSIYPVAGEFVGDTKAILRDKDRDSSGIWRAVENIGNVGGIGLIGTTLEASQFRGGLGRELLGPTGSGMLQFIEKTMQLNPGGIGKDLANDPTVKMATFVATASTAAVLAGVEFAEPKVRNIAELIQKSRRDRIDEESRR